MVRWTRSGATWRETLLPLGVRKRRDVRTGLLFLSFICTVVFLVWATKFSVLAQCGLMSHRTGCGGWEDEETGDLCKRRRVMWGWLTHKGMKRPCRSRPWNKKASGFLTELSAGVFHCSLKRCRQNLSCVASSVAPPSVVLVVLRRP